jgi:hypothetical protein
MFGAENEVYIQEEKDTQTSPEARLMPTSGSFLSESTHIGFKRSACAMC